MESPKYNAVTDAEWAVLEFIWDAEEATIRDIAEQLYPPGENREQATVQKLAQRLEKKGFLERDRTGFVHTLRARVSRAEYAADQLRAVADRVSSGSLTPLLVQLVESEALSDDEISTLRQLIDSSEVHPSKPPRKEPRK